MVASVHDRPLAASNAFASRICARTVVRDDGTNELVTVQVLGTVAGICVSNVRKARVDDAGSVVDPAERPTVRVRTVAFGACTVKPVIIDTLWFPSRTPATWKLFVPSGVPAGTRIHPER